MQVHPRCNVGQHFCLFKANDLSLCGGLWLSTPHSVPIYVVLLFAVAVLRTWCTNLCSSPCFWKLFAYARSGIAGSSVESAFPVHSWHAVSTAHWCIFTSISPIPVWETLPPVACVCTSQLLVLYPCVSCGVASVVQVSRGFFRPYSNMGLLLSVRPYIWVTPGSPQHHPYILRFSEGPEVLSTELCCRLRLVTVAQVGHPC